MIAKYGGWGGSGYTVITLLDMTNGWVTINIKEDMMPKSKKGMKLIGYITALEQDIECMVTYISVEANFATWSATRTKGGFDIRTFAVKAKPISPIADIRPGMSVLVDWEKL